MTKFVFVTGGVVSSLGKGIASASLAAILESRGLKVTLIKLDPYINVDPGTMSPFQHGEVFVTDDGAETDLDLGHYERFVTRGCARPTTSPPARSTRASWRRNAAATTSARPCRSSRTSPTRSRNTSARRRRRHAERGGRGHRRDRRHGRRHRVPALPGSRAPDGAEARPQQLRLRAPHLRALHRSRRRAQDQADPAHGAEDARDRHPARRPAVPRRPPIPEDEARRSAVHQRAANGA
jgi:hypothetical protein